LDNLVRKNKERRARFKIHICGAGKDQGTIIKGINQKEKSWKSFLEPTAVKKKRGRDRNPASF